MMNRGLGSIMGYRGGGMPVARFQAGGFTDDQVRQYFAENPGLNESQIAEAMRGTGVSPEQVARVTGADPGYVSQRYNQYLDLVEQARVPAPAPAPAPPPASPAEIQRMQAQRAEAELLRLREAERPIVDPRPQPAVDSVAQKYVNDFNALIDQGNYDGAARLVKEAELAGYGEDAYRAAAVALDANTNLPPELNFLNAEGIASIKSFVEQATRPPVTPVTPAAPVTSVTPAAPVTSVTPEGAAAPPTAQTTPGPGQIYGIPRFERQAQSNVPFAPLRRGLAQLRPAMYMPGLTSGQAPLGGSGFTPESLRTANQGLSPADRAYQMDVGGVSPAELAAATGTPVGQLQAEYNQSRPRGLFSTGVPAPKGLPEDFVLQTGAYGAPTPTFLNRNATAAGGTAAGVDQPTYAQLLDNVQRLSAQVQPLINRGQVDYGGGEVGFSQDPSGRGFFGDIAAAANAMGLGPDPSTESATGAGQGQDSDAGPTGTGTAGSDPSNDNKIGGLIRMAEGGGPPKMAELSAAEAGSTFDISKYIDDEGRLVGGYSKPIYDENRVITGYEYRPYERDVVFGEELRGKEERERMRNMAEGGLANVAQNLAERGRYGDSTLVHMAPEEIAGLRALARAQGTDMTINPRTGLPEAFNLKKLFKAASFILPFVPIPGLFGMSSLLTKSIFSGIAAGASAKGGFDLKQALGGGLRAYALGSLGEKMSGAPTPGGAPTAPTTTVGTSAGAVDAAAVAAPQVTVPGIDGDISLAGSYTGPGSTPLGPQSLSANLTAPLKVGSGYTDVAAAPIFDAPIGTAGGPDIPVTGGSLPPGADTVPGRMANVITPEGKGFGPAPLTKGTEIAMAGLGGLSLEKAAEEQRRYDMEAAAIRQEEEERERRFEELARRTLGRVNVKSGGQINLANGGMTYMEAGGTTGPTGVPRDVTGTGDGMSDSVPATIEGVQEARLADGEFVIPADAVADIGNGSSDAGSKKLYDMMDRIRKARHGTTKQPPEIRAERLMPA